MTTLKKKILSCVRKNRFATDKQISKLTKVTRQRVNFILHEMQSAGLLIIIPRSGREVVVVDNGIDK